MPEAAGAAAVAEAQGTERLRHVVLLLALAGLLFFLGLGTLGLTDEDEGRNAEAGREMFETGNWISPTFNYEPRFAKPALVYWLMSGAYSLFGVSEFSARLPSAVFGVALILLQYMFLTRVYGAALGLMGALMVLLNVEIVAIGRMAITDSVLIFFTTLSLFCFWLGLHSENRARHYFWGFYIGMALATLTKGPVGFLIPLLAVVPYLALTHRWGQFWRRGFPVAGAVLFLIVAAPWYAAMAAIHGSDYISHGQADTIGRFLNPMQGHGGTILLYVPVLLLGFFPWSGFLPMALFEAYKDWRRVRREDRTTNPMAAELEIFCALWLVVGFVFFSLSATRLPHYIAPLYPAAAILAASYFQRCLIETAPSGLRASFRTTMVLGYLMGILLAAGPWFYSTFLDDITKEFPTARQVSPGLSPVAAGLVLFVGTGLIGYFGLSERRRHLVFWVAGATIGCVLLIGIQVALPLFNTYFISPPQQLASIAGENLGPGDRLIVYGRVKASFVFYARRKVITIHRGEEANMIPYLDQPGRTMILLPARLQSRLPEGAKNYTVLLRHHGYLLLANQPMVGSPP